MPLRAKDIAELVGVSPATVSLVLNNKPGVSKEKRQEIIDVINDTGSTYLLKDYSSSQGNIGFVVYKREGKIIDEAPFFHYMLSGVTESVTKHGFQLSYCYMNKNMSLSEQLKLINNGNYKGLIIFAVEMHDEDLKVFKDSHIPFVTLDNSFKESDVDAISINNTQGIAKAVEYLYRMGHRRIGYIMSRERIDSFEDRYNAFLKKVNDFQIAYEERTDLVKVSYSEKQMEQGMREYLSCVGDRFPTAFIAENDLIGCNSVKAILSFGLSVPDDISIIGFDNRDICTIISPNLTTINVQKEAFGPLAVDLLLEKLDSRREYSLKIITGTSVIERESVLMIP